MLLCIDMAKQVGMAVNDAKLANVAQSTIFESSSEGLVQTTAPSPNHGQPFGVAKNEFAPCQGFMCP